MMRTPVCFCLLLAAAPAFGVTNTLQSVSPSSAAQSSNGLVITFTLNTTPPTTTANVQVTGATLGAQNFYRVVGMP